MKKVLIGLLAGILCPGLNSFACAQDSAYVRVHFLYGSKPAKKYRHAERRWFGGKLGGHAGVEIVPGTIVDFGPRGTFHLVAHRHKRHSGFTTHDTVNFYEIFGSPADSVQRMIITIPVSARQRQKLDSISAVYLARTPYDYAFLGMRCGAAAYDVLSYAGIVKKFRRAKTARKIFYPRKLRRRLMRKAKTNGWEITRQTGTTRRKWEKE